MPLGLYEVHRSLLVDLEAVAVGFYYVEALLVVEADGYGPPEVGLDLGGDVVGSVKVLGEFGFEVGDLADFPFVGVGGEVVHGPGRQRGLAAQRGGVRAVGLKA